MSAPKWQRARCTPQDPNTPGATFWVQVGPPVNHGPCRYAEAFSGELRTKQSTRSYVTNMIDSDDDRIERDDDGHLELLPEFAEEVEDVKFDDVMAPFRQKAEP